MVAVKGPLQIEGAMGDVNSYTRRGSDKIIVRSKGGVSKRKIKTSPAFANLRLSQQEWKGYTDLLCNASYFEPDHTGSRL